MNSTCMSPEPPAPSTPVALVLGGSEIGRPTVVPTETERMKCAPPAVPVG